GGQVRTGGRRRHAPATTWRAATPAGRGPWRCGAGWTRTAGSETTTWIGSGIGRHPGLGHGPGIGFGTGPGDLGRFRGVVLVEVVQALEAACLCGPSLCSGAQQVSTVLDEIGV